MRQARVAAVLAVLALGATAATSVPVQAPAQAPAPPAPRIERLGESVKGRPINVVRVGDPAARRKVLVVGCIHGDEFAGRAIVDLLRAGAVAPPGAELLLVRNLNPDGFQRGTRGNANRVDLNRNSSQGRRYLGPPGSPLYAGPRAFSEPESRAIRALIVRDRPAVTIWYHQPLALVDRPEAGGDALTRAYAALTGLPERPLAARPGSLSRWQNARVRAGSSIVVELPAGPLAPADARRHADAVLALAAGTGQ
ncbi:MAG: murein peptide amidase [Solirubrobacteraceae bacterium]|nr:murein peptide amidase [Solirubrobacteraceae bacterium]